MSGAGAAGGRAEPQQGASQPSMEDPSSSDPDSSEPDAADDWVGEGAFPRRALVAYGAAAWVLILAVFVVGIGAGAGNAAGFAVAPVSMIFVLALTFAGGRCRCLPAAQRAERAARAPAEAPAEGLAASADPPPRAPRMAWLDNAKVAMITCVVVGHTALPFSYGGAGISLKDETTWFTPAAMLGMLLLKPLVVPLFFFISGYFAPPALDRKGPRQFMRANLLRLAPAYFVWWLAINPLTDYAAYALTRPPGGSYKYFPNSCQTWFLNWLLVFQCCYALLAARPTVRRPVPSFAALVGLSLAVSLVQLVASVALGVAGSTLGIAAGPMNGPGGDGFFCACSFGGGLLARRSGWLTKPLPPRLVHRSRVGVLCMAVLSAGVSFGMFSPAAAADGSAHELTTAGMLTFFAMQIPSGAQWLCVQVCAVDFFQRRCNFENAFTRFVANAAFAVYLVHMVFINLYTFSWIMILRHAAGIAVDFGTSPTADTPVGSGFLYMGFVYVAILSVTSSFALGGLLKLIPGVRDLL